MRILLVDDSALAREILKQALELDGFQIVGQASNGLRGVELANELAPDLIIMDINMPVMDGLTATKTIMKNNPTPIMIFSTTIDSETGFEALKSGAVDIMKKPDISDYNNPVFYKNFKEKITLIAKSKKQTPQIIQHTIIQESLSPENIFYKIIVMGASTGGPAAVCDILRELPGNFPLGIVLVQHLESGFDHNYASWLSKQSALSVEIASTGPIPKKGEVIVAPVGVHLKFEGDTIIFDDSNPVCNQKPAVDVLFKSAACNFGKRVLGILLTGMGSDGALGCVEIIKAGGHTIVQNQETSAIFGMPKAAIEANGATEILPLNDIASRLCTITGIANR